MRFVRRLSILNTLAGYSAETFKADLIAGLTVGVLIVPQSMAYALLAGLPPIYGLYAGLFPLFLYGILGTSRQMSVGPVAISALLVLAGIGKIAVPGSSEYIEYAILAGLLIGIMEVLLSFLRFGFLVNFLSNPVIHGFTMAAAVIIGVSQLKGVLGFHIPRFDMILETINYALNNLDQTNWLAVAICLSSMLIMILLKRWNKNIPGALIVVIISTTLTGAFQLNLQGLEVIGDIPSGLPQLKIPLLNWGVFVTLLPTILVVTTIGFVESISIAKMLESKHRDYKVVPDQELFALGTAKIVGAFFQAMPSSGSFSRSAVNDGAGAKTGMASVITSLLVVLTLLFLTDWFYYTPHAVLAAIILLAVRRIFDYKEAIHLWRTHRRDFWVLAGTFLITLVAGIEIGVLSGVLISIFIVLYRSSRPHFAVLGRVKGTPYYRNLFRHSNLEDFPEILIFRFDDQLYFANANYFKEKVVEELRKRTTTKILILDCSNMHDLDSTGVNAMEEVFNHLQLENIQFRITNLTDRAEDIIEQSGLGTKLGSQHFFVNVDQAVLQFQFDEEPLENLKNG